MKLYDVDVTAAHSEIIVKAGPNTFTEVRTADLLEWAAQASIESETPMHHDDSAQMISLTSAGDYRASIYDYHAYFNKVLGCHEVDDLLFRYLESQEKIHWVTVTVAA